MKNPRNSHTHYLSQSKKEYEDKESSPREKNKQEDNASKNESYEDKMR